LTSRARQWNIHIAQFEPNMFGNYTAVRIPRMLSFISRRLISAFYRAWMFLFRIAFVFTRFFSSEGKSASINSPYKFCKSNSERGRPKIYNWKALKKMYFEIHFLLHFLEVLAKHHWDYWIYGRLNNIFFLLFRSLCLLLLNFTRMYVKVITSISFWHLVLDNEIYILHCRLSTGQYPFHSLSPICLGTTQLFASLACFHLFQDGLSQLFTEFECFYFTFFLYLLVSFHLRVNQPL